MGIGGESCCVQVGASIPGTRHLGSAGLCATGDHWEGIGSLASLSCMWPAQSRGKWSQIPSPGSLWGHLGPAALPWGWRLLFSALSLPRDTFVSKISPIPAQRAAFPGLSWCRRWFKQRTKTSQDISAHFPSFPQKLPVSDPSALRLPGLGPGTGWTHTRVYRGR